MLHAWTQLGDSPLTALACIRSNVRCCFMQGGPPPIREASAEVVVAGVSDDSASDSSDQEKSELGGAKEGSLGRIAVESMAAWADRMSTSQSRTSSDGRFLTLPPRSQATDHMSLRVHVATLEEEGWRQASGMSSALPEVRVMTLQDFGPRQSSAVSSNAGGPSRLPTWQQAQIRLPPALAASSTPAC
mmetsp:Transcript_24524/g.47092  ORF Transcript_24524/g.47092 Transcript_24524/m.47092 type:complete len:188 (+) Transcript_24524:744-1307(+)